MRKIKMNFWGNIKKDKEIIIAHRGARSIRAENTMEAFKQALGKSDCIEFDVCFSKDGIAVVIHDDTLKRTSKATKVDGFSKPFKVEDYTYEELLKLDFSSWFIEDDPFNTIKKGTVSKEELENLEIQRIPTLKEVLKFVKENDFFANIEIKDLKGNCHEQNAVKKVLKEVYELDIKDNIIISSFNHNYLREVYEIDPTIEIAALQEKKNPENIVEYLKELHVKSYNVDYKIMDKQLVELLNSEGFYVNVYTVNKPKNIKKIFSWGVKAIFTDIV
jgi:glycerophosphoryl diester phosphodiesterase